MTQAEALAILRRDRDTPQGRMLWSILGAIEETRGQCCVAGWCLAVSEDDIPAIWCRAVAVLRLPADVRRAAQWN